MKFDDDFEGQFVIFNALFSNAGEMPNRKGRVCSVPGCGMRPGQEPNVKLHSMSSLDSNRRKKWLQACSLSPGDPSCHIYVCSKHFLGGSGPSAQHPDPMVSWYCQVSVKCVIHNYFLSVMTFYCEFES